MWEAARFRRHERKKHMPAFIVANEQISGGEAPMACVDVSAVPG